MIVYRIVYDLRLGSCFGVSARGHHERACNSGRNDQPVRPWRGRHGNPKTQGPGRGRLRGDLQQAHDARHRARRAHHGRRAGPRAGSLAHPDPRGARAAWRARGWWSRRISSATARRRRSRAGVSTSCTIFACCSSRMRPAAPRFASAKKTWASCGRPPQQMRHAQQQPASARATPGFARLDADFHDQIMEIAGNELDPRYAGAPAHAFPHLPPDVSCPRDGRGAERARDPVWWRSRPATRPGRSAPCASISSARAERLLMAFVMMYQCALCLRKWSVACEQLVCRRGCNE